MTTDHAKAVVEPLDKTSLTEFTRLVKRLFEELNIEPEFHRHDQDVTSPLAVYNPPRGAVWFLRPESGQPAIGLAAVRELANRTCELKRFYVIPEERRKGYGQLLLDQALNFARQSEYMEILLSVRPDQKIALKLCERNGFKPCARYHPDGRSGIFYSFKFSNEVK